MKSFQKEKHPVDITSDQYGYRDEKLCRSHSLPPSYKKEVIHKILFPRLRRSRKGVFLDLGAGKGEVSEIVKSKFKKLTVIVADLSRFALIDINARKAKGLSPVQMDGSRLSLADNSVDLVHCKDVIVHFYDLDLFFKELHRVTKKNARVIIAFVPTDGYFMAGSVNQVYTFPLEKQSDYLEIVQEAQTKKGWFVGPPFYDTSLRSIQKSMGKLFKITSKSSWIPEQFETTMDWYQESDPERTVLELVRR